MRIALRMTLVTLVVTGFAYPLAVTALAQLLFPKQANGSLVTVDGVTVGSELIGQRFSDPGYFQGRPSAAGRDGYDARASGGSNLGPTSKTLQARIAADLKALRDSNPEARGPVPDELVTASGSGLDPHLPPLAAHWQAPRIAQARGAAVDDVDRLIDTHVEPRGLGFLGEPRVNVLALNVALDARFGRRSHAGS